MVQMVATLKQRLGSACFYSAASFLIIIVNKVVLTSYRFPDQVLALGQLLSTLVCLRIASTLGYISIPPFSRDIPRKIWPLPLFYFGNLATGLGGTKRVSLPMLVTLRRFSILMTLFLEECVIGNKKSTASKLCIYGMMVASIIAGSGDLSFDLLGYSLVCINNLATALNGVFMMKKLQAKELGTYGLLFYNCLFSIVPTIFSAWCTNGFEEVAQFASWDAVFIAELLSSCLLGSVLLYSTMVCTLYNTALTTGVIGVIKNTSVTYIGMFIGGDYIFSYTNFIGLNLSAVTSLVYSYIEIKHTRDLMTTSHDHHKNAPTYHPEPSDVSEEMVVEVVSSDLPSMMHEK